MKYASIPSSFFSENRQKLIAKLPKDCVAVVHSSDIPWRCADGSLRFIQNSDLFYLTGIDQEDTVLVLAPGFPDPEKRETLFVRETSDLIKIWEGSKLTREEAAKTAGIPQVKWSKEFPEHFRSLTRNSPRFFLNHNEHARSASPIGGTPDDRFRRRTQSLFPHRRFERLAPLLHELRQEKNEVETELIRRACEITKSGFLKVLSLVRPGIMEYEVEAEFAREFLRRGSCGFAYEPIIAAGSNACVLHYLDNDQECRDGDLLLMDVAAEYANYNSDLTRTIPVNGKYTKRQREVYEAVYRVFDLCINEFISPGKNIRKEFGPEVARVMEEELIGLGLLDRNEVEEERAKDPEVKEEKRLYRKYFMHGVSHSLGIDVHDVTISEPDFVENMIVTVEPGIYIEEEGIGVRLENDIIVRYSGNIDLMADIPILPGEIEALMSEN